MSVAADVLAGREVASSSDKHPVYDKSKDSNIDHSKCYVGVSNGDIKTDADEVISHSVPVANPQAKKSPAPKRTVKFKGSGAGKGKSKDKSAAKGQSKGKSAGKASPTGSTRTNREQQQKGKGRGKSGAKPSSSKGRKGARR